MTIENSPTLEYIMSLEPEQMSEAFKMLPPDQKTRLISELCRKVGEAVTLVLDNKEQIWEDR